MRFPSFTDPSLPIGPTDAGEAGVSREIHGVGRGAVPGNPPSPLAHRLRAAAAVISTLSLVACASWPARNDTPDADQLLRNSLPVAAAALGAGQLDVARRLYLSLEERFEAAPEPVLGLAYVAFQSGDLADAERYFVEAADRASEVPAMQAEALLGAGRVALSQNRTRAARRYFRRAASSGQDTPSAAWIANGLGVVATLGGDHERAEAHFAEALQRSGGHPRIAANHVRMLFAAGRIEDVIRVYERHPPTWWSDGDGPALSRLIERARRERYRRTLLAPAARVADTPSETAGARVGAAHGPAPGSLDPNLTMRLDVLPPAPAGPNADTPQPGDAAAPEPSWRVLRLGRWSTLPEPAPAAGDPDSEPAPDTAVVRSGPPAPAAGRPEVGDAAARASAARFAASGAAESHPVPEPAAPVRVELQRPSVPTLGVIVGQSRRLHLDYQASSVLVTTPEVADVRLLAPDVVYVIGKGVGRTTVAVLDDNERVDEWVVSVVLDLEPLNAILAGDPDLARVRARRLTRGVALAGEVASAADADRALRLAAGALPEDVPLENDLQVAAPQQVNLEVQIAEVHRSVTENLGVNWEAFRREGSALFGFRIGHIGGAIPGTPGPIPPSAIVDGQTSPSIYYQYQSGSTRIAAMVDALATAGLANVLARPNVTAVSGEAASFFSGGEFPLPTGFDNGVLVFTYKKYGVLLDFVPTVVDAGRIVLTVRPEVSEPSRNQSVTIVQGVSVPVINVRRAETTVEVADGESIVIAGLFRNAANTVEAGLPGLKDLPMLGLLFGTTSIRSDELELIVIVTARLVEAQADSGDTGDPSATLTADGYHY